MGVRFETPDELVEFMNANESHAVDLGFEYGRAYLVVYSPRNVYQPVTMHEFGWTARHEEPFGMPFVLYFRILDHSFGIRGFMTRAEAEAHVQQFWVRTWGKGVVGHLDILADAPL